MRVFRRLMPVLLAGLLHALPAHAQQRTQDFVNPTVKGIRLDFCRNWGRACGQPAADLFCREMGLERAVFWQPAPPGIGIRPLANRTLVFGDGRICEGPTCAGFAIIRCAKRLAVPPPAPPQFVVPQQPATPPPQPVKPPAKPVEQARPVTPKPPDKPVRTVTPKPAVTAVSRPPATRPKPRPQPPSADIARLPSVPADLTPVAPGRSPVFTIPGFSEELVLVNWMNVLTLVKDYPDGASLFQCAVSDCGVTIAADLEIDPAAENQSETFNWSVVNVPYGGGALWQVSYFPFPPFAKGGKDDLD
ncbi:MAG TPA: hypothetical protein VLA28_06660, partial [Afifellaceae bacterium]|nr:hypothetical protein [Afifellaceae bacterium]